MKARFEQRVGGAGSSHIPSLDGLRAISILFVLIGHLAGTRGFPHSIKEPWMLANFGVRVFFVISGYLITTLLLKELELSGRISLKNFYLRRAFRIFPAAYTYVLVIAILALAHFISLNPHDLLHAITYTSNYSATRSWYVAHLWSLSVEEQFYLLWPLTLLLLGKRSGMRVVTAICFLAPVIRVFMYLRVPGMRPLIENSFETVFDSIATGCFLAGSKDWLEQQSAFRWLSSSKVVSAIGIAALTVALFPMRTRYQYAFGDSFMNIAIALTLYWCIKNAGSTAGKFLNARPVAFIGVLSYSLYLWQQPFLDRSSHPVWTSFPLNIFTAAVLALCSHYIVEKPFLQFKKRFEFRPAKGSMSPPRSAVDVTPAETYAVGQ